MKHLTNFIVTAAAALIVTAGVASAQNGLKAEVPFAFHVDEPIRQTVHRRLNALAAYRVRHAWEGYGRQSEPAGNSTGSLLFMKPSAWASPRLGEDAAI